MTIKPSELGLSLQKLLKETLGIIKETSETDDHIAAQENPTPEHVHEIFEKYTLTKYSGAPEYGRLGCAASSEAGAETDYSPRKF